MVYITKSVPDVLSFLTSAFSLAKTKRGWLSSPPSQSQVHSGHTPNDLVLIFSFLTVHTSRFVPFRAEKTCSSPSTASSATAWSSRLATGTRACWTTRCRSCWTKRANCRWTGDGAPSRKTRSSRRCPRRSRKTTPSSTHFCALAHAAEACCETSSAGSRSTWATSRTRSTRVAWWPSYSFTSRAWRPRSRSAVC